MIKKNGGIFGRNPTYNDVVVEGVLTLKEAQVFDNDITINGDLTVNGTETVINTVELNVDDKNITMGAVVAKVGLAATTNITAGQFTVQLADTSGLIPGMTVTKTSGTGAFGASPKIASVDSHTQITLTVAHATSGTIIFDTGGATDDTADGGGITLKGLTDKFIKWVKSTAAWTFSDKIEAPDVTVTNLTATLPVFTDANKKLITQSQQNALNAIAGAVTAARFLRGDGTNVTLSAIQAADVPTLNQNTTGNAATATTASNLKSNATTGLLQVTGPGAGTTRVMTVPNGDFTVARTDAAQNFAASQTFAGTIGFDTPFNFGGANYAIALTSSGSDQAYVNNLFGSFQAEFGGYYYGAGSYKSVATSYSAINLGAGTMDVFANTGLTAGGTFTRTKRIGMDTSGNVTVSTGNLIIGTSGKGIDFSATSQASGMTSELLSDYEEGTWTPVATSGSGSITGYTASGRYTKIGDTLTVFGSINITGPGTAGGNLNFSGLPYTAKNLGAYIITVQARENNVTGSNFSTVIAGNNTTGIILGANWTTNVIYLFSATYQVQ